MESSGRAPGQRVRGQRPPKAETLLAFGRLLQVANLPTFNKKLKRKKKSDTICVVFF